MTRPAEHRAGGAVPDDDVPVDGMPDDDARAHAVRVISAYHPADPAQRRLRRAFLDHLAGHPDALGRGCLAGHLTASALVVDAAGERVLLMLHGKARRWLQMGGHVEAQDVGLAAAAAREAREESGVDGLRLSAAPVRLDRHDGPCHPTRPPHLDVQYLAWAPADAVIRNSAESHDLAWFGWDDLPGSPPDAAVVALARLARHHLGR